MANVKISELPVATDSDTPDVAAIVQSGVTKQVDVNVFRRSPNFSIYGAVYDAVFIRGITADLSIGDNDVYTVPTGRRAAITIGRIWNDSGGNVVAFSEVKHSGTYYRIGTSTASLATGTGAPIPISGSTGIILSAGHSLAVNAATTAGANAIYQIIEFSDESVIKPAFIFGPSTGDNTLYTVPAGKTASIMMLNSLISGNMGTIAIGTGAVGTGTVTYTVSRSGGSPIVTMAGGSAGTNTTTNLTNSGFSLEAGDSVIINITTGDSAQIVWGSFFELDA